jgi:hypothetical protein
MCVLAFSGTVVAVACACKDTTAIDAVSSAVVDVPTASHLTAECSDCYCEDIVFTLSQSHAYINSSIDNSHETGASPVCNAAQNARLLHC